MLKNQRQEIILLSLFFLDFIVILREIDLLVKIPTTLRYRNIQARIFMGKVTIHHRAKATQLMGHGNVSSKNSNTISTVSTIATRISIKENLPPGCRLCFCLSIFII